MNRWFDHLPIVGKRIPGKITLSFLMLVFAIIMYLICRTVDRRICIFAMFFSFVGDIALNHNRDHSKQSKKDFLIGGIAFIIAHLLYCISYYMKIQVNRFDLLNYGFYVAFSSILVITIVLLISKKRKGGFTRLFWFGMVYVWITGINYTTITSYAISTKSMESIVLFGGIMFFLSDLIIGLEKFYGLKSKVARELVWWLYPVGQIIIIAMA